MNSHTTILDKLPEYAAGSLDANEIREVEIHLRECAACREELVFWKNVSKEIKLDNQGLIPPAGLVSQAIKKANSSQNIKRYPWRFALDMIKNQIPLVQRDIWPASAIVILMGYLVGILAGKAEAIQILGPLVGAACITLIYGHENDPAFEMTLSTPVSPWQILLARTVLVFGYNLILCLAASIALLPLMPYIKLDQLILGWVGPMTFLSALALLLSIRFGNTNAIWFVYGAWILQWVARIKLSSMLIPVQNQAYLQSLMNNYVSFWQLPGLLIGLSLLLFAVSLWIVNKQENSFLHLA